MKDKAQASLDKLLGLFNGSSEAGMAKGIAEVTMIKRQNIGAPSENWSLGNVLIMLMSGTTDARTFNQWKKVGRYPKKGSKAFHILKPFTRKIEDKETGEDRWIVTGFGSLPVFAYESTEGDEVDYPDYSPVKLPPLYEVAEQLGVSVSYAPGGTAVHGYYVPGQKHITVMTHDESVFFHELAHAADDKLGHIKQNGSYKAGEVVAETVAATLALMYGLASETETNASRAYIEGYAGEKAGKAAMKVLSRVEKVLDLILSMATVEVTA